MLSNVIFKNLILIFVFILFISCDTTKKDWEKANRKNTIEAYEEFTTKHPKSVYDSIATAKIEELYWQSISSSKEFKVFEEFMNRFPQSKYISESTKFNVELSTDWFSEIVNCESDLAKIPEDAVPQMRVKGSVSGPETTYKNSEGIYVCCIPDPKGGKTLVSGTVETIAGSFHKIAKLGGWTYTYSDSLHSSPNGWAICVTSGELVLPTSMLAKGPINKFVDNSFEVVALCRDWLLISLNPDKNHRICLEQTPQGESILTVNYPGTVLTISKRVFSRQSDGWYFSLQ